MPPPPIAHVPSVAIVTGDVGGSAEGGIVLDLARQGTAVMLLHLDDPAVEALIEAIQTAGGTALAVRADLEDAIDVERAFDETIAVFGSIDAVIDLSATARRPALDEAVRRFAPGADLIRPGAG